jgi:hypothetical protein
MLRWFMNQAHNEVVWALSDHEHNRHNDIAAFNPCGVEDDAQLLLTMDREFEDSVAWISDGRNPSTKWWWQ